MFGQRSVVKLIQNPKLPPNRAKKIKMAYTIMNKNRPILYTTDEA